MISGFRYQYTDLFQVYHSGKKCFFGFLNQVLNKRYPRFNAILRKSQKLNTVPFLIVEGSNNMSSLLKFV